MEDIRTDMQMILWGKNPLCGGEIQLSLPERCGVVIDQGVELAVFVVVGNTDEVPVIEL
jgi:hypothetical protein